MARKLIKKRKFKVKMNNIEIDDPYLLTLFLRISAMSTADYKLGENIMKEIDEKLEAFAKEPLLWCLRGLAQKRYWELDYARWIEDKTNKPGDVAWYRRKIQKDFTDQYPVSYYFKKALALDPGNKEFEKLAKQE